MMNALRRKPVLVPVDYSDSSLHAAAVARTAAEDGDVTLVHVVPDLDLIAPSHNWVSDIPRETDAERLNRLREWSESHKLDGVGLRVETGDPGTEVCRVAEESGTQLIVVPSHGRHGLKRLLLGSVAERIVRYCDCSVLVLRRPEDDSVDPGAVEPFFPRKKVVVPIDFSESSLPTIRTALETVSSPDCVDVLNVVYELDDPIMIGSQVMTSDSRRDGRQEYLNNWLKENNCPVSGHVVIGDPGIMITDYAQHVGADLIVMPSHGYHGLSRLVLGSTTERVLRYASAPVLVLRRHDAE